jgi:hypothetical protein
MVDSPAPERALAAPYLKGHSPQRLFIGQMLGTRLKPAVPLLAKSLKLNGAP